MKLRISITNRRDHQSYKGLYILNDVSREHAQTLQSLKHVRLGKDGVSDQLAENHGSSKTAVFSEHLVFWQQLLEPIEHPQKHGSDG